MRAAALAGDRSLGEAGAPSKQRSALVQRSHVGPLVVQRALYPEGPTPVHAIVLHPPGGVAASDRLQINVDVEPGAWLLVTTPATTKIYKSAGELAHVAQHLSVAASACLEWLPQETLLFNAARLHSSTQIDLEVGAHFVGWEIQCFGRHHAGERFAEGRLEQRLRVNLGGRSVVHERLAADAGAAVWQAAWGLRGARVCGTWLATTSADPDRTQRALTAYMAAYHAQPGRAVEAGITQLDGLLVLRALAPAPAPLRALFEGAWACWRQAELGRDAARPRIWDT